MFRVQKIFMVELLVRFLLVQVSKKKMQVSAIKVVITMQMGLVLFVGVIVNLVQLFVLVFYVLIIHNSARKKY